MAAADQSISTAKKNPFLIGLFCLIGTLGLLSLIVTFFYEFHPLARKVSWAIVIAANLALILHAVFKKKNSDVAGEFHAYNMISWLIAGMIFLFIAVAGGLIYLLMARSSGSPGALSHQLPRIAEWAGAIFAGLIAYGWLRWLFRKKK